MDFSSQDALDAAQRIVRTSPLLVGASAPPAQAPSLPPPARAAATVLTLGPGDPPPFDRTYPSLFFVLVGAAAVIAVVALLAQAFRP